MSTKEKYDYIFKLVVIGNSNCGKSSLLHYFVNNKMKKNPAQTVGVEFASKVVNVDGRNIKLQLWDTAGQERYRSIARTYYRGTLGALVVFDVTNHESYAAVRQWISDAREFGRQDIQILVCGNKIDLKKDRVISQEQGNSLSAEERVTYIETSAYTGENVEQTFNKITEMLLGQIEKGSIEVDELKPRLNQPSKLTDQPASNNCGYC